jgi:hypothetical protein
MAAAAPGPNAGSQVRASLAFIVHSHLDTFGDNQRSRSNSPQRGAARPDRDRASSGASPAQGTIATAAGSMPDASDVAVMIESAACFVYVYTDMLDKTAPPPGHGDTVTIRWSDEHCAVVVCAGDGAAPVAKLRVSLPRACRGMCCVVVRSGPCRTGQTVWTLACDARYRRLGVGVSLQEPRSARRKPVPPANLHPRGPRPSVDPGRRRARGSR